MQSNDNDDEVETHIFSLENGDDWFYFEDSYTSALSDKTVKDKTPFTIGTISGTETEVMRLKYKAQPKHTVVHKGACSFTGISTSAESGDRDEVMKTHDSLTVQVHIDDL